MNTDILNEVALAAGVSLTQAEEFYSENEQRLLMDQTGDMIPDEEEKQDKKNNNKASKKSDEENNSNNNDDEEEKRKKLNKDKKDAKWMVPPLYTAQTLYSIISYALWYGGANCMSNDEMILLADFLELPLPSQLLMMKLMLRKRRMLALHEIVESYGPWIKSLEASQDLQAKLDEMMAASTTDADQDNNNIENTSEEEDLELIEELQRDILLNICPETATRKYLETAVENNNKNSNNNSLKLLEKWDSDQIMTQIHQIYQIISQSSSNDELDDEQEDNDNISSPANKKSILLHPLLFKLHSFISELCTMKTLRQIIYSSGIDKKLQQEQQAQENASIIQPGGGGITAMSVDDENSQTKNNNNNLWDSDDDDDQLFRPKNDNNKTNNVQKTNNNNNNPQSSFNDLEHHLLMTQSQLTEKLPNVYNQRNSGNYNSDHNNNNNNSKNAAAAAINKLSKHAMVIVICENFELVHESGAWNSIVGPVYFLSDSFRMAVEAASEVFQMVCGDTLSDSLVDSAVKSMQSSDVFEDTIEKEKNLKSSKEDREKEKQDEEIKKHQRESQNKFFKDEERKMMQNMMMMKSSSTAGSDFYGDFNEEGEGDYNNNRNHNNNNNNMMMMMGNTSSHNNNNNPSSKTNKQKQQNGSNSNNKPAAAALDPKIHVENNEHYHFTATIGLPQHNPKQGSGGGFGFGGGSSSSIVNSSVDSALLTIPIEFVLNNLFSSRREGTVGGSNQDTTAHPTAFFTPEMPLLPHCPDFFSYLLDDNNNNNKNNEDEKKNENNNRILNQQQPARVHLWSNPLFGALCREAHVLNAQLFEIQEGGSYVLQKLFPYCRSSEDRDLALSKLLREVGNLAISRVKQCEALQKKIVLTNAQRKILLQQQQQEPTTTNTNNTTNNNSHTESALALETLLLSLHPQDAKELDEFWDNQGKQPKNKNAPLLFFPNSEGDVAQFDHPSKRHFGTGTRSSHLIHFLPQYQWLLVVAQVIPMLEKRKLYTEAVYCLEFLLGERGIVSISSASALTPHQQQQNNMNSANLISAVDSSHFILNVVAEESSASRRRNRDDENQHHHNVVDENNNIDKNHHHHNHQNVISFVPTRKFAFHPRKRGEWHYRLILDLTHLKRDYEALVHGECLLGFVQPFEKIFANNNNNNNNSNYSSLMNSNNNLKIGSNGIPTGVATGASEFLTPETLEARKKSATHLPFGVNQELRWFRGFDILSIEKTFKRLCSSQDKKFAGGSKKMQIDAPHLLSNRLSQPDLIHIECDRDELNLFDLKIQEFHSNHSNSKSSSSSFGNYSKTSNLWERGNRVEIAAMIHYQQHLESPFPLFDPLLLRGTTTSSTTTATTAVDFHKESDRKLKRMRAVYDLDLKNRKQSKNNNNNTAKLSNVGWKGSHVEGGWIYVLFSAVFEKALTLPYGAWQGNLIKHPDQQQKDNDDEQKQQHQKLQKNNNTDNNNNAADVSGHIDNTNITNNRFISMSSNNNDEEDSLQIFDSLGQSPASKQLNNKNNNNVNVINKTTILTPYEIRPRDTRDACSLFYRRRKELIHEALDQVSKMSPRKLAQFLNDWLERRRRTISSVLDLKAEKLKNDAIELKIQEKNKKQQQAAEEKKEKQQRKGIAHTMLGLGLLEDDHDHDDGAQMMKPADEKVEKEEEPPVSSAAAKKDSPQKRPKCHHPAVKIIRRLPNTQMIRNLLLVIAKQNNYNGIDLRFGGFPDLVLWYEDENDDDDDDSSSEDEDDDESKNSSSTRKSSLLLSPEKKNKQLLDTSLLDFGQDNDSKNNNDSNSDELMMMGGGGETNNNNKNKPPNSASTSSRQMNGNHNMQKGSSSNNKSIDCRHHRVVFVEVKSPNDSLSNKQRVVNDLLLNLGFCVHVCRVNEKKVELGTNSNIQGMF